MAAFAPRLPLAVAYSAGADSTALLLACAQRWPGQVLALHVHHGLQAAADTFAAHARHTCDSLGVPLYTQWVTVARPPGASLEAQARHARYQAFSLLTKQIRAQGAIESIAMAHHADDQAETVLLALSRGAGLPGLAAMPAQWHRDGLSWHRPLLGVSRADVRTWLVAQGADWVEDPSNADQSLTRNRLRARLVPALDATFDAWRDTLARSARHAAQAQTLLDELAAQDLAAAGVPPRLLALQALSAARLANVLRHWLHSVHGVAASTAQLDALMRQVQAARTRGHRIHIKVGPGHCVRLAECLDWYTQPVFCSAKPAPCP